MNKPGHYSMILKALEKEPMSDSRTIAGLTGLELKAVQSALTKMNLKGIVERHADLKTRSSEGRKPVLWCKSTVEYRPPQQKREVTSKDKLPSLVQQWMGYV